MRMIELAVVIDCVDDSKLSTLAWQLSFNTARLLAVWFTCPPMDIRAVTQHLTQTKPGVHQRPFGTPTIGVSQT
jgi:hypothetical protein